MSYFLIHVTCDSKIVARKISKYLVEYKIVACVNIIDQAESFYHWQGKVCNSNETFLITKNPSYKLEYIIEKIKTLHNYENPAIIATEFDKGSIIYLN